MTAGHKPSGLHPILVRVRENDIHEQPSATTPRDGSRCRHPASVAVRRRWHQEHPSEGATTRTPYRPDCRTGSGACPHTRAGGTGEASSTTLGDGCDPIGAFDLRPISSATVSHRFFALTKFHELNSDARIEFVYDSGHGFRLVVCALTPLSSNSSPGTPGTRHPAEEAYKKQSGRRARSRGDDRGIGLVGSDQRHPITGSEPPPVAIVLA